MKIKTAQLKVEVEKILNEEGWSNVELAIKSNVAINTIDRILKLSQESTQRAIARKIAEGSGRKFKIEGDKIYFFKPEESEEGNFSEAEKEMIELFRKLDPDTQSTIKELAKIRAMKTKQN